MMKFQQMSVSNSYYVTTPIFYPNGEPHIGHAYTMVATDMLARYKRLDGKDVFYLTGTDEHGQKMQQTAEEDGITALELADRNSAVFRSMAQALSCSNDDFVRTTEERHKVACQKLWNLIAENDDIYLGKYDGENLGTFETREDAMASNAARRRLQRGHDKLVVVRNSGSGFYLIDGENAGPPHLEMANDPRNIGRLLPNIECTGYYPMYNTSPVFEVSPIRCTCMPVSKFIKNGVYAYIIESL